MHSLLYFFTKFTLITGVLFFPANEYARVAFFGDLAFLRVVELFVG